MTIVSKEKVRAAVERAIDLGATFDAAVATAAQALCLSVETVREALQIDPDRCECGQDLVAGVCEDCDEVAA